MNQYVIIGNGVAAAGCIEGIRSIDTESSITVISEENYPVYCRPLISYYLEGKTTLEKMNYRPENFYEKNACQVIYGKKAANIDNEKKIITLDNGSTINYTTLCLATGSRPFVPPIKGLDTVASYHTFLTLDDSLGLEKAITPESRVLIVGAGLIGLKCAEGIIERAKTITVCDLADRVLSSILDAECAVMMQNKLEEKGVNFMLEDTAVEFIGNTALMKSGANVEFDVLVMAVGVHANIGLAQQIGCETNRGILIDENMQTSVPGIYAAGDCSEGFDSSLGAKRVLAILPNAYMQGRTAGMNMAGSSEVFDNAIPMNSIGFFGYHAMTAGSYFAEDENHQIYEEKTDTTLKKMFVHNNHLTGYILIGNIERAGIYTSLIREKTPLDSVNFDVLKKNPSFRAFTAESRSKKFGGVV